MMKLVPICLRAQMIIEASGLSVQTDSVSSAVTQSVAPFMASPCHVGLSMVLVMGRTTRFFDFGSTSRDTSTLPSPDSIYEIGSVTKTFTGALAAKAALTHRLELDADFREHLPGTYPNLAWQGHPITLRSLATHRSGLPRDLPDTDDLFVKPDFETLPTRLIARDSGYDRARYLGALRAVQLRSNPGAAEQYSNLGIKVIGWGLEKVYAEPYERLMQKEILQPLGMSSTGFVLSSAAEQRRLVQGYSRGGNAMPYHLRNAGAAYGLYSTVRDMAKYLHWQLDESIPVVHFAHELIQGDTANGKALIWNATLDHGERLLWHGGGTFGMTSQIVLYPDTHEGYGLFANDTCAATEGGLKDIAMAIHHSLQSAGR
jgi:D-alanyl-D-alanine-carboxypeptidase/D-alanyl-D-alanine-endopeptidase